MSYLHARMIFSSIVSSPWAVKVSSSKVALVSPREGTQKQHLYLDITINFSPLSHPLSTVLHPTTAETLMK